jgi:hypothetical protein
MKKKNPKSTKSDYQTAMFLWTISQIVPNNRHILKEARRCARAEQIQAWYMDAIEFIDNYEEDFGKVERATKLPPELANIKFIPIAPGIATVRTSEPPHSQN